MPTNHAGEPVSLKGECFRLLAACCYLPEKELLGADQVFIRLTRCLSRICPAALPFVGALEAGLERYSEEELAVEYARLFVGPFELKAPPYGSVYLDPGRAVMGDSTAAVHEFYLSCGLKLSDDFHELPDHIAVELEFVSFLLQKELEALAAGRGEEAEKFSGLRSTFLTRYLLPWLGRFCAAIREGSQNSYFTALADCLEAVASEEAA